MYWIKIALCLYLYGALMVLIGRFLSGSTK